MKKIPIYYLLIPFIVIVLCLGLALYLIPATITPLLIGLSLAYAFDPLIDFFEKKGFNRNIIVLLFFILLGLMLFSVITILVPYLFLQLTEFIEHLPEMILKLWNLISLKLNIDSFELKEKLTAIIQEQYNSESFAKMATLIKTSLTSTTSWFSGIAGIFIIPVFFYFFLIDIDRIKISLFKMIPAPYQDVMAIRFAKIDNVLSGFIRGQLMVALILAFFYSILLSLVGIKYGFLIGFIAGLLNIIPYVGVFLGITTSILMAFFSEKIIITIVLVLLIFVVVQMIEGFIITPKVVGEKVGLSSLATIIAILIGGELLGVVGMFIAIPVGGVLRVIYRDLKSAYLRSEFYQKEKQ